MLHRRQKVRQPAKILRKTLDQGLDAVSNFLAGALTISQGLSQELPEFEENFRKNREWFVQFFLPHLEKTEAHDPWICKDYCVEAVKKSVDGNQQYQQKIEDHTSKKPS